MEYILFSLIPHDYIIHLLASPSHPMGDLATMQYQISLFIATKTTDLTLYPSVDEIQRWNLREVFFTGDDLKYTLE